MHVSDNPSGSFRLPLDVKPTHYELTIKTDLEQLTFQGLVHIEFVPCQFCPTVI
jgi:aminopeptidase 2